MCPCVFGRILWLSSGESVMSYAMTRYRVMIVRTWILAACVSDKVIFDYKRNEGYRNVKAYFMCLHFNGSSELLLGGSRSIDVGVRSLVGRSLIAYPCPPKNNGYVSTVNCNLTW